jgi:hypothetical protein
MTREDSAFDGGELNYRYWPDYDAGELDELLPVPPGLLSRCLLTFGPFASATSTPTQSRTAHGDRGGGRARGGEGDSVGGCGHSGGRGTGRNGGGSGGGGGGHDDDAVVGLGTTDAGDVDDHDSAAGFDMHPDGDDCMDDGAGADSDLDALKSAVCRNPHQWCATLLHQQGAATAFQRVRAEVKTLASIASSSPTGATAVAGWIALVKDCPPPPPGGTYAQWLSAIETACVTKLGSFALSSTDAGFDAEVKNLCSALGDLRAHANAFHQPTGRARQHHSRNC